MTRILQTAKARPGRRVLTLLLILTRDQDFTGGVAVVTAYDGSCDSCRAIRGEISLTVAPRFRHVHFHVIARLPDWPEALRGASVFSALGDEVEEPLSGEILAPLALQIRGYLLERLHRQKARLDCAAESCDK